MISDSKLIAGIQCQDVAIRAATILKLDALPVSHIQQTRHLNTAHAGHIATDHTITCRPSPERRCVAQRIRDAVAAQGGWVVAGSPRGNGVRSQCDDTACNLRIRDAVAAQCGWVVAGSPRGNGVQTQRDGATCNLRIRDAVAAQCGWVGGQVTEGNGGQVALVGHPLLGGVTSI